MYKLFLDTDCDVTPEIAAKFDAGLISMGYMEKEKEIYPYETWDKFEVHHYYQSLRFGAIPKTFGLSPKKYIRYFEPVFQEGKDILYIHFSQSMSGTFNAMNLAYELLKEKYPERKLYTFDTKAITICSLNMIYEMGELYLKGATPEEVIEFGNKEVDHFATYFYADNLKFFAKSGRVHGLTAAMGNILGIRPLIFMDADGQMKSISKARGRLGAINALIDYVKDLGDHIEDHRIIIAHCDCPLLAKRTAELLQRSFKKKLDIIYVPVNPTAGAHCGPDCVGVCFHSKHR